MRGGKISVDLDATAQPSDRFLVGMSCNLAMPTNIIQLVSEDIARREAKRLVDMGLGLLAATEKIFGKTDERVRAGQISIQRQRLLAFGDALSRAVRKNLDDAQYQVGHARAWAPGTEP